MRLSKVFATSLLVLLLFEWSGAKKTSGSRKKNKNTSGGSRSGSGGDNAYPQTRPESKSSSGSYPMQNSPNGNSYAPTQKIADTKPSAPVQTNTPQIQQSSWNNLQQSYSSPKSRSQFPSSNSGSAPVGWNIPGSKANNNPPGASNSQTGNGWTSGYQTQQKQSRSGSSSQLSSASAPVGWNIPGSKANNNPAGASNSQTGNGWTSGYRTQQKQSPSGSSSQLSSSNVPHDISNSQSKNGWTSGYQSSKRKSVETNVKKENTKLQQSSPNQPQPPQPGWNAPGQSNVPGAQQGGWKSGYQTHGAPPSYPHHNAAPPAYNGQPSWGAPPGYPGHAPGGYGGFGHSNQYSGGYGGHGGGYPQQSVGGYNPGYGGMAMGGMGMGGMGMAGMGGYGHQGGFGGMSPLGGGYSPARKSFFSASTIGSVVAGMLVYNMASSLISHGLGTKRPYTVVNYYNQAPDQKVDEIKLPSNVLILCDGNSTQLCGQGTQSICTQNGTVLCVATMNQASPCDQGGKTTLCVNTTMPCVDENDALCQNSTKKEKLEVDVNIPCFTNVTLDVNLLDKTQTVPNTKYTYCVTTMAIAGPEYEICEDITNTNDYRSVLNGNYDWFLEIDGFRRNYSIYNYDRPMETNGDINMPITVLVKCTESADKICAPGSIPTCTSFNEIMCMKSLVDVEQCSEKNATCVKSEIPCSEGNSDLLCQNKTEDSNTVTIDLPCFANITINAPIPKFNLVEFNGTLPDLSTTSSYTYHFNYCVVTLALPGSDSDLCITKEAKEKQDKEQIKS